MRVIGRRVRNTYMHFHAKQTILPMFERRTVNKTTNVRGLNKRMICFITEQRQWIQSDYMIVAKAHSLSERRIKKKKKMNSCGSLLLLVLAVRIYTLVHLLCS